MLFLTPTYPTAVLSGLRIVAIFNELWFYKKKAVSIINFQPRNFHTSPLFKKKTKKLHPKILGWNLLIKYFICEQNFKWFNTISTWISFFSDQHSYFKIYPPGKSKQLLVIFILNHINSSLVIQKIDFGMWFRLVHRHLEEVYQLLNTCVRFLFTALFFVIW